MPYARKKRHYRSIFLSDIHLGDKGCRADFLLDFLRHTKCDHLYLIGDIVDIWALKSRFHWPKHHHAVLKRLIKIASKNTEVIYIPGNHDNIARNLVGDTILNIEVHRSFVHTTACGRKFLLCHGDEFDNVLRHTRLNKFVGDAGYHFLLWLNRWGNRLRRFSGRPYWSSCYLREKPIRQSQKHYRAVRGGGRSGSKSTGLRRNYLWPYTPAGITQSRRHSLLQ